MKSYQNPLEDLFSTPKEIPQGEEVEGTFMCQESDPFCDGWSPKATLMPEINTLSWVCSNGHVNSIKDFSV